ncbi:hypothetical protein A33K_13314 [Burkholderia humptydooensis MSMB43]|uniref:Uncharacterized protein n=1 Tax=Burkholderia humptydooensis MSMB43 TaxID=441157 RepID=A0ABN0GBS4_9BURK|nr:hypothetical protein A33K_13314 [Burkholderia humptydooensis MSMB43]
MFQCVHRGVSLRCRRARGAAPAGTDSIAQRAEGAPDRLRAPEKRSSHDPARTPIVAKRSAKRRGTSPNRPGRPKRPPAPNRPALAKARPPGAKMA